MSVHIYKKIKEWAKVLLELCPQARIPGQEIPFTGRRDGTSRKYIKPNTARIF